MMAAARGVDVSCNDQVAPALHNAWHMGRVVEAVDPCILRGKRWMSPGVELRNPSRGQSILIAGQGVPLSPTMCYSRFSARGEESPYHVSKKVMHCRHPFLPARPHRTLQSTLPLVSLSKQDTRILASSFYYIFREYRRRFDSGARGRKGLAEWNTWLVGSTLLVHDLLGLCIDTVHVYLQGSRDDGVGYYSFSDQHCFWVAC